MKNLEQTTGKTTKEIDEMPCWAVSELIVQAKMNEEPEVADDSKWVIKPFYDFEHAVKGIHNSVYGRFVVVEAPVGMPDIYIFNNFYPVFVGKAEQSTMETGLLTREFMDDTTVWDAIEQACCEETLLSYGRTVVGIKVKT